MHIQLITVPFCIIREYLGALEVRDMPSLTKDGSKSSAPALTINFQCPPFVLMECFAWVSTPGLNTE